MPAVIKKLRYYLYYRRMAFKRFFKDLKRRSLYLNNSSSKTKNLLVVKLDSIGDYLLFRNFLQVLKESERYCDHTITLCGNSWWKDLSEDVDKDWVTEFIWVDYHRLEDEDYNMAISKQLYSKAFDVALTPTYSRCRYTDELMLQSGAKVKFAPRGDALNMNETLMFKNEKRYTRLIELADRLSFEFERNSDFFSQVTGQAVRLTQPKLTNANGRRNTVIIAPGAKAEFRRWSPENFYQLALHVKKQDNTVEFIICGAPSEVELAEKIIQCGNEITFNDLTGKINLLQLAEYLSNARLLLCNDSGPYHLGAALNTPVICMSNGNHYRRFCPYPAHYGKRHLELFPPSLNVSSLSNTQITELQTQGSAIDINEIRVELVIAKLEATDFFNKTLVHT